MARRIRLAILAGLLARAGAISAAPPTAGWNFDEPAATGVFADAGPRGLNLRRGAGSEVVTGSQGNALRPMIAASGDRAAGAELSGPAVDAAAAAGDLSPGTRRWSLSAVLRLELEATNEGVLYALAVRPPGMEELVFSIAVAPAENAFVVRCLGRAAGVDSDASAVRIAFSDPGGPPHREAISCTIFLVASEPLPRGRWIRAELEFAGGNTLTLRVDGTPVAAATANGGLEPMPGEFPARLTVGADRAGRQPFPGLIDELSIRTDPDER
jgi:hypothetical protein